MLEIISPCLNEGENVDIFINKVRETLKNNNIDDYLITIVDDGSNQKTLQFYKKYYDDKDIRTIILAKNYGHQTALVAGLENSMGDHILVLDLDLQDPIEIGLKMYYSLIAEDYDIVMGIRLSRDGESFFKLFTANIYYKFISFIANDSSLRHFSMGDFYVMTKNFKDSLIKNLPTRLYIRGVIQTLGFQKGEIYYKRDPRKFGKTKFSTFKMVSLALSGVLSLSTNPLRIIALMGGIGFLFSILLAFVLILWRIFLGTQTPGWTFTVVSIYLCTSILLFSLSVIAEYIGLIVQSQNNKQRYFIRKFH